MSNKILNSNYNISYNEYNGLGYIIKPLNYNNYTMYYNYNFVNLANQCTNLSCNLNNFTGIKFANNTVTISKAFCDCHQIYGEPFNVPNTATEMYNMYVNCYNLNGPPKCGPNIVDFFGAYVDCYKMTGSPVCGKSVYSLYNTYYNCTNLTGSPACGLNVTSMEQAYELCSNLTGAAVCGDKVTNMWGTYCKCSNLNSAVACGPNVVDMTYTYQGCSNLVCSPICGNNVVEMEGAYKDCINLATTPVCGDKVTGMYECYKNCHNLTGAPVSGPNVISLSECYTNCYNLQGTMNWFYNGSSSVDAVGCFYGHNNNYRINIYCKSNSPVNTYLYNSNTDDNLSLFWDTFTWETDTNCYYNTNYNIYVYYNY